MIKDQVLWGLYGACAALCAMIGLVFVRYWTTTRDRLFLFFAFAFWCFSAGWVARFAPEIDEHRPYVFIVRLVGFLLIIAAIYDKNRRAS
jgi:hypothetical protein